MTEINPRHARAIVIDPMSADRCVRAYLRRPEYIQGTSAYRRRISAFPLGSSELADDHLRAIPSDRRRRDCAEAENRIRALREKILRSPRAPSEKVLLSESSIGKDEVTIDTVMENALLINHLRVGLKRIYDAILDARVVYAFCIQRSMEPDEILAGLGLETGIEQKAAAEFSVWSGQIPGMVRVLEERLEIDRVAAAKFVDGLCRPFFAGPKAADGSCTGWYAPDPGPEAVARWLG